MFSFQSSDALAYYTWLHGAALGFALVGGLAAFALYFTRKYDGGKIIPGMEWRRGTGHGVYAGQVTQADLYSHNHKGKSYWKAWKRTGKFLCFCGAAFVWVIALLFPDILKSVTETEGCAWARDFALFRGKGPTPLSEVLAEPAFLPSALTSLLALITGFRLAYGMLRLPIHRKRRKSTNAFESLSRAERACMGLTTVDCFVSLGVTLAFLYPVVRAFLCLFGEGAAEAQRLPEAYYTIFPFWQGGLSLAFLAWAVVQSVRRRKISKQYRR